MKRLLLFLFFLFLAFPSFAQDNRYDEYFRKYSKRYFGVGFDWKIFKAQAMAESNLSPDARSWVGAIGIMQLIPSTFKEIQSINPDFNNINDPRWNIAAGIYYNRNLWWAWTDPQTTQDKLCFMFGSYNAGIGTISRAKNKARETQLDHTVWESIESVAPTMRGWRYRETLGYIEKINGYYAKVAKKQNGLKDFEGK